MWLFHAVVFKNSGWQRNFGFWISVHSPGNFGPQMLSFINKIVVLLLRWTGVTQILTMEWSFLSFSRKYILQSYFLWLKKKKKRSFSLFFRWSVNLPKFIIRWRFVMTVYSSPLVMPHHQFEHSRQLRVRIAWISLVCPSYLNLAFFFPSFPESSSSEPVIRRSLAHS